MMSGKNSEIENLRFTVTVSSFALLTILSGCAEPSACSSPPLITKVGEAYLNRNASVMRNRVSSDLTSLYMDSMTFAGENLTPEDVSLLVNIQEEIVQSVIRVAPVLVSFDQSREISVDAEQKLRVCEAQISYSIDERKLKGSFLNTLINSPEFTSAAKQLSANTNGIEGRLSNTLVELVRKMLGAIDWTNKIRFNIQIADDNTEHVELKNNP